MNESAESATALGGAPLSPRDFALLGVERLAYIKQGIVDGQMGWEIHSADGNNIGSAPERDLAFAAVIQHDMEPVSVH